MGFPFAFPKDLDVLKQ